MLAEIEGGVVCDLLHQRPAVAVVERHGLAKLRDGVAATKVDAGVPRPLGTFTFKIGRCALQFDSALRFGR